ncbi:CD99 antigen-like protein 2 isoform X4 [Narcine bancroftii]|uniref:CD99 antigen-like protein 2 isoform X4 n=1 Tax=Narcine bancroftii TaxID=1343680 RepID=UPI00383203E0
MDAPGGPKSFPQMLKIILWSSLCENNDAKEGCSTHWAHCKLPVSGDVFSEDVFSDDTTLVPPPAKPHKPLGGKNPSDTTGLGFDLDLADALDDNNNNGKGGQDDSARPSTPRSKGNKKPKEGISDKDLEDLLDGGDYHPDKKKSDGPQPSNDQNQGDIPETTIAGIASAIAAALLGTVTSYIAYQKKKLCFKVQESLNQA